MSDESDFLIETEKSSYDSGNDNEISVKSLTNLLVPSKDEAGEQKIESGFPTQYTSYNGGYLPSSTTVPILKADCYDIVPTRAGVIAVPAIKPSGLLLELPEMLSDTVIKVVENFWNSEKDYKEGNEFVVGGAAYKLGIMLFGPPGCHAKGQGILMYDGSIKKVEDIVVGDLLMGPDSTPREVLKLCRGREEMVKIIPTKGNAFIVNKSHILSLMPSGKNHTITTAINMKVSDFMKQSKVFRDKMKQYRVGVEFTKKQLDIPPYILGIWLGDGTSSWSAITTMDKQISDAWENWAKTLNLSVTVNEKNNSKAATYTISNQKPGLKNEAVELLRNLNVINNKHIPNNYLLSSTEDRLELLAGLLDTDGHASNGYVYDIVQKSELLADQILYLARSLGFAAYKKTVEKYCIYKGIERPGTYYRISISGDCDKIPVKIPRKIIKKRQQIKSVLRTGFKMETLPEDDFYGFSLDKDHLYLLDDFTVTHNSGKSSTIKIVSKKIIERDGVVFHANHPTALMSFLNDFSRIEPNRKCVVILEDIDSLIYRYGEAEYLELLDSAKSINNVLFIATTNYPDKLDPRIYNRPGRFSHVIKIGLPTAVTREAYLKAILKNHQDVDVIVKNTEGFTIDHLTCLINARYREKKDLMTEIERLRTLFKVPRADESKGIGFSK